MGVVRRRWMWAESMGVVSVCGCKEVYRFPHITYPYSSCIFSFFAAASLLFVYTMIVQFYLIPSYYMLNQCNLCWNEAL